MRTMIRAHLISGLAACVCLLFAANWADLASLQVLIILAVEGVAGITAMALVGLISLVATRSAGQDAMFYPSVSAIVVGTVLGPIAGAVLAALAVVSLHAGAPDAARVWRDMAGIARMFGYAGLAGGASFWWASRRRRLGTG